MTKKNEESAKLCYIVLRKCLTELVLNDKILPINPMRE